MEKITQEFLQYLKDSKNEQRLDNMFVEFYRSQTGVRHEIKYRINKLDASNVYKRKVSQKNERNTKTIKRAPQKLSKAERMQKIQIVFEKTWNSAASFLKSNGALLLNTVIDIAAIVFSNNSASPAILAALAKMIVNFIDKKNEK